MLKSQVTLGTWCGPGSGYVSQGRDVQGTRRPRDILTRGRVDRGTRWPRNASPKRQNVHCTHCPRDEHLNIFVRGRIVMTHGIEDCTVHCTVGILAVLVRDRTTVAGLFPGAHFNAMAKTSLTDCVWKAEYQLQLFLFNLVREKYIQAHIRSIIIIWTFFPFKRIME